MSAENRILVTLKNAMLAILFIPLIALIFIYYIDVFPKLLPISTGVHIGLLVILYVSIVFYSAVELIHNVMLFAGHGIFVFGLPVSYPCEAHPEDTIKFGDVTFTYNEEHGYYLYVRDKSATTIVFMHGNGNAACCWCDPQGIVGCFLKKNANIGMSTYRI